MGRSWTKEQLDAINLEGTNIIVSAGAGSGKTAVLTERVLRKLKAGVHINELLVLTFTKNAAFEMKERIRSAIKKVPELKDELDLLDGAYITTFDSFALSVVNKYHYLKNMTPNVQICEATVLTLEKSRILDKIIDDYYTSEDKRWEKLISDFCVKDDVEIHSSILSIYHQLDMRYDKHEYLSTYLTTHFNEEKINKDIDSFFLLLQKKIKLIEESLINLSSFVDGDYFTELSDVLKPLLESNSYKDIVSNLDIKLKNLPRGSETTAKKYKETISSLIKELKALCIYQDENNIKDSILSTKDYVSVIIEILLELDRRIMLYKNKNDLYEFTDIAKIAIDILSNNQEIREEMKGQFQEILIDEYQDTNDIQETFISLISNHNVYMVGDIKQSIYRFRNANPYIFKNKYDKYQKGEDGIKIDLNKNFRSRKEPLDNINLIFNAIMNDNIGGAMYQESHQMIFGNLAYIEKGDMKDNRNLEIYSYTVDKESIYSKEEYEIFLIAKDIQEKISTGYLVYDKDEGIIRKIRYDDFVILIDRTTMFDLYKKIFEYMNIPLTIYKDENVASASDIQIIKNLIRLVIEIKNEKFSDEFKYSFMSIGRSFLCRYSDQELFAYFKNQNFKESSLYQKVKEIASVFDTLTCSSLLDKIMTTFEYNKKLIEVGDVTSRTVRLDYLKQLSRNLEKMGYTILDFLTYIETVFEHGMELKVSLNKEQNNSCKIMTIHKSKGLEYYICYYAGLSNTFNIRDLKEKFIYDQKYGFIVPFYDEGISQTIYKQLLKEEYLKEEISEKIRLFYVALTRCKEKMIMIASMGEETEETLDIVSDDEKMKYRSFLHILKSIHSTLLPFIKEINTSDIPLTKDYNLLRKENLQDKLQANNTKLEVVELEVKNDILKEESYSKKQTCLRDKSVEDDIMLGKEIHYLLEIIDFKNPNLDSLPISSFIKEKLSVFLSCDLIREHLQDYFYHEYEFVYKDNNVVHHGIIDLLIESKEEMIIVDYKLRNISDENYKKQLKGYQEYITKHFNKTTKIYLYSILDGKMMEVK